MILSDKTIREELAAGRIVIDPQRDDCVQPSSVDLHVDRFFRVFLNHTQRVIDVKDDQENLTELVEVLEDEAFILHPGEFVLGSTLERVALPDDLVARLEGKALALDTEVPTPSGWTTMGELAPGDSVFDESGHPTLVVAVTAPMNDRPCRRVFFSDGTEVVADAGHQWVTVDKNGRRYGRRRSRVVTTEEIRNSVLVRGERNHQVALAGPAQFETQELPIDPYVFGAWLGDGTTTKADGKFVPTEYLVADEQQRLALLQGLMDTDGYVDAIGRCEFTNTREHLADAVVELAASLGFRPYKRKDRAKLNGIDCGPRYRVAFTPHRPVFRLPRKLARQKLDRSGMHRFRSIARIEEEPQTAVRCIQVASPSGQFLITRSFIPTHNSSLGRLGLLIHSTAGFVDAGWDGHLTLELSNVANLPITIYPGMKIGQISFLRMTTPADVPYGSESVGSKYQGQRGPTPSRYFKNFEK
ncbi:MAG TPA: dCTP deaminase [Acidimicrobiales bacterium]|nr:dCTP deaminase [Acidimicrobiales bacterium]